MNMPSKPADSLPARARLICSLSLLSLLLVACSGGGGGGEGATNVPTQPVATPNNPTTPTTPVATPPPGNTPSGPSIVEDRDTVYAVQGGNVEFVIDKQSFNLQATRNGAAVINSMSANVRFNGQTLNIGIPEFNSFGNNWVQQQGWFDQARNLWYVAQFRFWDDVPFAQLTFSITDRHEDNVTEAHWDNLWQQRQIEDLQISFESAATVPTVSLTQENAFSGGDLDRDPRIEEVARASEVHWRQTQTDDGSIQLQHDRDNSGQTFVTIHPRAAGEFDLTLRQQPLFNPYPAANQVDIEIQHAGGLTRTTVDQGNAANALGRFTLNQNSWVRMIATGVEGDRIVFGQLELTDPNGITRSVQASRVSDDLINTGPVGLVVKDFWKKFPINASADGRTLALNAIQDPVGLVGGVGFTFDIGINADSAASANSALVTRMRATPEVSFPQWWPELDGREVNSADYRQLQAMSSQVIRSNDEVSGNYGLMNWGDFQIGPSFYFNGDATEDWGALQYDLGLGLLNAWIQTGDEYLFNRAQAAVRSSMDIQIAKFEPYGQKRSGAGIRKGQCSDRFHWCQENIPEFNYHSRSLLLYSHLTGEQWPREIAQMVIDNSAYFSWSRRQWTVDHERILGWSLRNLYYGAEEFPEGTRYNDRRESSAYPHMVTGTSYTELLNGLVSDTVSHIERNGRLPGVQPVWGGQIVEGLIIAMESGHLSAALATRTRSAIDTALRYFIANHMRGNSASGYDIAYDTTNNAWRDAEAYGWFWVNNFAWASENLDGSYRTTFENFYDWLDARFRADATLQTTRAWTGVMGFSAYAAERRNP